MSVTYKLSQFSKIAGIPTIDSLKIFQNDTWFETASERFISMKIENDELIFIDRKNTQTENYIPIDISINPSDINMDYELTINQLVSILFSVNQNKNVYLHLATFVDKIRKNPHEYRSCISSNTMKVFASHIAWLWSGIGSSETIPDWIKQDLLFSEISSQFEKIHQRKLTKDDIPPLSIGMEIYSKTMYLAFLLVRDKMSFYLNSKENSEFYEKMYKGFVQDVRKFNDVLTFV